MKSILGTAIFLLGCIGLSRYLPFVDSGVYNFTPLLATAVLLPGITSNKGWYFAPTLIYLVTGIFMPDWSLQSALMPMLVISLSPFIAKHFSSAYAGGLASWLVWHISVNAGLTYPPFSYGALVFDLKVLVGTMLYITLYKAVETLFYNRQESKQNLL